MWQALTGGPTEVTVHATATGDGDCDHGLKLLNTKSDFLTIISVGEGPWMEFNKKNASKALRPHDGIVAVNGVRGDGGRLMDEMRASALGWGESGNPTVSLTIKRPRQMRVAVRKGDEHEAKKLGLSLLIFDGSVVVTEVQASGMINLWNAANPDLQVSEGDRVAEVNGLKGDGGAASAQRMLDMIHRASTVDMVIETLFVESKFSRRVTPGIH